MLKTTPRGTPVLLVSILAFRRRDEEGAALRAMSDEDSDVPGLDEFIEELTKKKISTEVVKKIEEHGALSDVEMWTNADPQTLPAFYEEVGLDKPLDQAIVLSCARKVAAILNDSSTVPQRKKTKMGAPTSSRVSSVKKLSGENNRTQRPGWKIRGKDVPDELGKIEDHYKTEWGKGWIPLHPEPCSTVDEAKKHMLPLNTTFSDAGVVL